MCLQSKQLAKVGEKNPHNLIVMDTVWGFSHKTFFRSNITAVPVFSSLGECPGTSEEDGFLKSAEGAPANTFSKKYMMRHWIFVEINQKYVILQKKKGFIPLTALWTAAMKFQKAHQAGVGYI